ncbi:hypothetical protein A2U01_0091704, partial [Trifolium medium]|nr:hypothetical protein [Trifolium medium]
MGAGRAYGLEAALGACLTTPGAMRAKFLGVLLLAAP